MDVITVESDLRRAIEQLRSLAALKQVQFATAKALTLTAVEVQRQVRAEMPARFTLRRQWIVNGIRVEKATKANLVATVFSRDAFMGLQEFGGQKDPRKRFIAIPTKAVRRTKSDIIAKSDRPQNLGARAEVIEYKGNKWLALKRARSGRSGNELRLLYLLVPRAQLHERLGLREIGTRVTRERFMPIWRQCLEDALPTSR